MKQPKIGWCTKVTPKRVIDGDTIVVEIKREIVVRITNEKGTFNTPEIRKPADEQEIELGIEAREYLESLIKDKEVILFIPGSTDEEIQDIFSIGARAVGMVFVDGEDITEILDSAGYNKSSKNYQCTNTKNHINKR